MKTRSIKSLAVASFVVLTAASLTPVVASGTTYHFGGSPKNTNVTFESETDFETILGSTREISGTAVVDFEGGTAETSLEVPVDTLRTGIDLRDQHLRRPRRWSRPVRHYGGPRSVRFGRLLQPGAWLCAGPGLSARYRLSGRVRVQWRRALCEFGLYTWNSTHCQ